MNIATHGLFRMALAAALSMTVSGADASGTSDGATSKPTSASGAIPSAEVMLPEGKEQPGAKPELAAPATRFQSFVVLALGLADCSV